MPHLSDPLSQVLAVAFIVAQALYLLSFLADLYLYLLPVDWVEPRDGPYTLPSNPPTIVLFYPVLRELEATMRTTLTALERMDYPAEACRVVAIPNASDGETVASLQRLAGEFPFLELLPVPPTSDPAWDRVWQAWDENPHCYWWSKGAHVRRRDLPPKKTRQLIFALYHELERAGPQQDFVVTYIDADSAPPADHFRAAAAGLRDFDVLQAENVAGNLNKSWAASMHALDHMIWDGSKYAHMSAQGRQPYWMLGKGLFFRASTLARLGGFNPWLAIEDPEVGMRFWADGQRLGILKGALIEEVPETFMQGVTQRKRWVCGFFQSLGEPLRELDFSPMEKLKAWMNFAPCLSLGINLLGWPTGAWALWSFLHHDSPLPAWTWWLAGVNVAALCLSMAHIYVVTWRRTALVLSSTSERLWYMLRVNPVFVMLWWLFWIVPLVIGLKMYLSNGGLVWDRTEKVNANEDLVIGGAGRIRA